MIRWTNLGVCVLVVATMVSACTFSNDQGETEPTGAAPTPTSGPSGPTSNDLIATALENGEIDPETALTYKVFAQFSDARLPAMYKGVPNLAGDSHILDELQAQFPTLSPETQALLLPFLAPPIYKGSWAYLEAGGSPQSGAGNAAPQSPGEGSASDSEKPFLEIGEIEVPCTDIDEDRWDYKSAMHSPVRFWWDKSRASDEQTANHLIAVMDDDIWPKLTSLMGKTPLPDEGTVCNGGSPDLDIYITPLIERSAAPSAIPPGCKQTPSFIFFNPKASDAILAHEFMHTIQWSYNTAVDCMYPGNYAWLAEATAEWSQDYVYPDSNEEQGYVPWFYEGSPPTLPLRNDRHEYGAYLFFFYLTHHFNQPAIVKNVWDNTVSMASLPAVDQAIPGGFEEVWADFAVDNIVEPPHDDYQQWDQFNGKPSGSSLSKYETEPGITYAIEPDLSPLVIKYYWITFGEGSRLITFFNGLGYTMEEEPINTYMGTVPIDDGTTEYKFTPRAAEEIEGLKVQAYFKVQGDTEWQLEDWTDVPYMSFCRDASSERLTDLVIIFSNSSQEGAIEKVGSVSSRLLTSDIGCWRYGGDASFTSIGIGEGGSYTDEQKIPNVAFERTDAHPNIPYPILRFKVAEGQWDRSYEVENEEIGCRGTGEAHAALQSQPGSDLFILYGAVNGPSVGRYSGSANTNLGVDINIQCPQGNFASTIQPLPWFFTDMLSQVLGKSYLIPEGGQISGSDDLVQDVGNATFFYTWNFEPLAQTPGSGGSSSGGPGPSGSGEGPAPGGESGAPQSQGSPEIPGVPTYPNIESSQRDSNGMVTIFTTDSMDAVVEFYRQGFVAQGWTDLTIPGMSTEDSTQLTFMKGTTVAYIQVATNEGRTSIIIYQVGS